MFTFVEAISLAGDRAKQNDDALGHAHGRAWVIDGATDLQDKKFTGAASDAAWIAHFANARFHAAAGALRDMVRDASEAAAAAFARNAGGVPEKWMSPIASLLMAEETSDGVAGLYLGDCRMFALDAGGAEFEAGPPVEVADAEAKLAAQQQDADKPLLRRESTIAMLRQMRGELNGPNRSWTFGLDPACADHARAWSLKLKRPAHVLLMTDGFSALTDRYGAYTKGGLVQAALSKGLEDLGREIRAIENADAGSKYPRFKKSDDATAVLMRLS
ncbi:hypothetical protein [Terricaulis sp.]|uniref:hypothetical protein n=1 Tax=Terricaulis sp. TaxID=2768686 RepID=UPI0037832886